MKKYFKLISLSVFFVFLFSSCAGLGKASRKAEFLKMDSAIVQGKLENGMSYYVQKNSEPKNRIVLRLVVKAGSNMEEDDQKGVAHFIEHLAFNGTENFKKSEIVDYFEKIGMDFGSDLNAYTNFDETVYKLEIPADDEEILKNAILILHDWACAVTFEQEEIDKERGVVTEEWRLHQGLRGRVTEKIVPLLLKDSRYTERLPIGDMDVIHNISRERILDFYEKWYRPEFMSIVAVGDVDESVLENAIVEKMQDIAKKTDYLEHPVFEVEPQTEKNICLMRDPEQKYEVIQIFNQREDFKISQTVSDVYDGLKLNIGRQIFNQRLGELSNLSVWLEAFADSLSYTHSSVFEYVGVVPKEGDFENTFKAFLDEWDRMVEFGITKSELNRVKEAILKSEEQSYKNKDKVTSASKADSIVSHALTGNFVVSADDYFQIINDVLPKITVDEVNSAFRKYYAGRGTLMFLQVPDTATDIPTEEEIMTLWTEYKNPQGLTPYNDEENDDDLMERPKSAGRIVVTNENSDLGIKEYVFENGIRVLTKKTDFVQNQITMQAVSKGGLYLLDEDDVPSGKYCVNYMLMSGMNGLNYNQLIKKLSTKNCDIDISVTKSNESISGYATNEDFEVLMQMVNLVFSKPQFTEEGWKVIYSDLAETAKNHGKQPNEVLVDAIINILYKDDIFYAPLTTDYLAKVSAEKAEKAYLNRFENPADFTFVFVGDFDENKLLNLLSYYLGSLKTSDKIENYNNKKYEFPKGITSKIVNKGLDKQGQVYISFGGELPAAADVEELYYEKLMSSELCSLLDIRLREVIREDKSGSYGIGAFGGVDGELDQDRSYYYEINFGCEPERAEELKNEVLAEIENLQKEPVSMEYTQKMQETLRRGREVNVRKNNWWITRILNEFVFENEPVWVSSDIEKICQWITPEEMQKLAKKYLNTQNYVNVILEPEK